MRIALALTLAAALAAGGDAEVALVDGERIRNVELLEGSPDGVVISKNGKKTSIAATRLVGIQFPSKGVAESEPFHLYLANGDRVRGTVEGRGDSVGIAGEHLVGFSFPLTQVRAVRLGTLVAGLRGAYHETFLRELKRGRDVVIVQQDAKPFPFAARVLEFGEAQITVRVGQQKRSIERHKVYGFVLSGDATEPAKGAGVARIHLERGGRLTGSIRAIDAKTVALDQGRIALWRPNTKGDVRHVLGIEYTGGHFAHIADLVPLDTKSRVLFGDAPKPRKNRNIHGAPIRIAKQTYAYGLGVCAYSRIEYALSSRWKSFYAACGIDAAAGASGEATFRVLGDGKILKEITCRRGQPAVSFVVDVTGVDRLVLECNPGESYISDFCNWADAKVFGPAR